MKNAKSKDSTMERIISGHVERLNECMTNTTDPEVKAKIQIRLEYYRGLLDRKRE